MRLDKFLCDMAQGARSEIKKQIRSGGCVVNGEMIRDPGFQVSAQDTISLLGRPVIYREYEYYMLNKPAGILTATEDKKQETVLDLFRGTRRTDLFPVGRLDKDTEGLLLITNNGALAHRLLAPKSHVDKVYAAVVSGIADDTDRRAFEHGIRIGEDLVTLPAALNILSVSPETNTSKVIVTIHEGKFHQIKKMFLACGKEVISLKRLAMGPLSLDPTLRPGEYRHLTAEEQEKLLKL